MSIDYQVGSH
jgi:hypothetical protein